MSIWLQFTLFFRVVEDEEILSVTRVMIALNKFLSFSLKKESCLEARQFLEKFTNSVLSTVTPRSNHRLRLILFCPAVLIGGNDLVLLQLFGLLLKRLLEKGWLKGSAVEACRAEYQSFMQGQRKMERSSTMSRSNIGNVLVFCSLQAGYSACWHLFKVCIVTNAVEHCFNVCFE